MRWLFRLVGALLVLGLLGLAALAMIPSDRVARLASDRFEAVTGRALTIEGSVKPSLWPVLGVETGRVTLANAPWSKAGPMLVADGLTVSLDLRALVAGTVRITGFGLTDADILLERSGDGLANWVFGGANGGTAEAGMAGADVPFTLDLAQIDGGSLRYIDHGTGREWRIDDVAAELRLPDYAGPLTVAMQGTLGGRAVSVDATVGDFAQAYSGAVVAVEVAARAGDATMTFAGRGGTQPLAAEGQLDADLGDLADIAAVLGTGPVALPEGLGAQSGGRSVGLAGKLTRSGEGDLYLRGGRIALDDTVLTGDLDLSLQGARPRLVGRLAAESLAFGSDTAGGGGTGGESAASGGWSQAPLSAEGLWAADVDLALSVEAMRLGGLRLQGMQSRITVDAGRMVADLGRVGAYGGTVAGQVVVNARKGLSVGGKLDFTKVALQPLLMDVAGIDRLIGTGDLAVDFVAAGGSVAALMRGLDGQGRLALGAGEIRGIDVPAMLAKLDASDLGPTEKTVFDALDASFTIRNGDLFNDDLALRSPYLRASGSGRIGLAARDFDYRLRATALQGTDGADRIAVPLSVTGPWAAPKVSLDLEALAQEQLGEQAKAAEDELRRRAAEELGQQEGESLEDAAKRKMQETVDQEAGSLLQQLLGGN